MPYRDERGIAIGFGDAGEALEARYTAGEDAASGGSVIAAPHPLYGGSIDSPVVEEIAFGFRQAGLATLSFNWRGVGASAGQPSGEPEHADEDYAAALEHLIESVSMPIIASGYSFGAAAAIRASRNRAAVRRLVLVAPPPSLIDRAALEAFTRPVLAIVGESDSLARAAELEAIVAALPQGKLEVVPEADHFFGVGLGTISRAISSWLADSAG
ncbi:MAG: alpha/beta fold hydrolase [Myxococcota bacterium]